MFGDIEIEKCKFHRRRNMMLFKDVDIKKIRVPSIVSSGKKIINVFLVTKMTIIK